MDIDLMHFDDIPPADRAAWDALVAKALGTSSLDRLQAVTADGIVIPPLAAPRTDRDPLAAREAGVPWSIVQQVPVGDPAATNAVLLDELMSGADGVDLIMTDGREAGASAGDFRKLMRVLEGVYLDMVAVHFTVRGGHLPILNDLLQVVETAERPAKVKDLHLGLDPYADAIAGYADYRTTFDTQYASADMLVGFAQCASGGTIFSHRGQNWHAAGASDMQQLAIAIATGVAFLRDASARLPAGSGLEAVAGRIGFRLVANHDQFMTIAKFRAFRRLWALVLDELGLAPRPAFVHAEPAWRTTTRRDPWVNIIRSTIATFAAAVGGADAITTTPYTALLGRPDDAARRLSRNIQTVLMDESNIHRVADPAAGSGGIETLTDRLAERAWEAFAEIEREGGLAQSLRDGGLLARIAGTAETARGRVATRREPITGVSTYPLLAEPTPAVAGPPPPVPPPPFAPPLDAARLAEPWEALRDRSDAFRERTGARPAVFLANLGPVAAFTARATWAKNLFEAGGIEAATREGHRTAESVAAAFAASGARIACLCSDDRTYAELAASAAAALKAAGAETVYLAGRPKEGEAELRAAGVDRFVREGEDVLAFLTDLNHRLTAAA